MKKIYTITLDDEVPLSDSISSDIKEIAYCLFEEIAKYEKPILVLDDKKTNLVKNELLETHINGKYNYRFESENSKIDNYHYEPFLINNKSFGFTVHDESITEEEILKSLASVLTFLGLNYKFNIDSIYYDDALVDGRLTAYKYLTQGRISAEDENNNTKTKKKTKTLTRSIFTIFPL